MYYLFYIPICLLSLFTTFQNEVKDINEQLIEAVEAILIDRYPHRQTNLHVRIVRTGGTIDLNGPFEILFRETREVPRALQRVEVQSTEKNETGWALVYIAHYDSVLAINRSVKKDERVSADDLNAVWTETTRFHGEPLTPATVRHLLANGDIFANRFVTADRILKRQDLRNAYAVSTGQSVSMHYQRRGISLSLTCKARSQGFTGDLVKLYSPDTQLMYKAKIIGPGVTVWVETLE